jgi:hypothetical protein
MQTLQDTGKHTTLSGFRMFEHMISAAVEQRPGEAGRLLRQIVTAAHRATCVFLHHS